MHRRKLHPIAWLFAGSLLLTLCRFSPRNEEAPSPQNGREFSITELKEMLIEVDALNDRKLEGEYTQALTVIDSQCQERPQTIVLKVLKIVEEEGRVGEQYAALNYLEVVESAAQDYQTPVECILFL